MIGRRARMIIACGALLVTGLISLIALDSVYYYYSAPLEAAKTVVIPKGTSLNGVAHALEFAGVIRYPQLFKINVLLLRKHRLLKAGEYLFPAQIAPKEVLEKMVAGEVVIRRLTIPEGFTTMQIVERLKQEDALTGEIEAMPEEGALLPETYFFSYGDSRMSLIKRMKRRMKRTAAVLWEKRKNDLPLHSLADATVLASIVEKETGRADERGRVAAVFINRLKKGMPLQSDPTVIYALTKGQYVLDRPLSKHDLRIESPFNTYMNAGLPPAPIANPGIDALSAVMNPPETNELYFVASGEGGHVFSATLDEHNRNVSNYRKKLKQLKQVAQ